MTGTDGSPIRTTGEEGMNERIYRTPRTYGAPTGYDHEVSHMPNIVARLSESLANSLATCSFVHVNDNARLACDIAEKLVGEWERRGWMLKVEDAPAMDKDYAGKRGSAE